MNWFLYNNGLVHERVNIIKKLTHAQVVLTCLVTFRRIQDWHELVRNSNLSKPQRSQLQTMVYGRFQVGHLILMMEDV